MKIKFDSNQDYQLQAVQSVVNLFEGQALADSKFEISFSRNGKSIAFSEKGVSNNMMLSEANLLKNVQAVQQANGIALSDKLEVLRGDKGIWFPNFTVEMETGTGKTYTYLRTIYELNEVYGFKKFVVVVPSIAIREGVVKNLQITHDHFQDLYKNPAVNFVMYDSKNKSTLRNFAVSDAIQILVINIDSFTKDNNIINTMSEKGIKPIELIQATNPIVIIDEPQNFETEVRRQAITNLNPAFTLRYSATHKNLYNLVYSLNPVQAYDLGLVKQIEVDGITSDNNYNSAFIQYKGVTNEKANYKAKIVIHVNDKSGVVQKEIKAKVGDDLYELSNKRDIYQGYTITGISRQDEYIEFDNGIVVTEGQTQGGMTDDVMKFQIERTIRHHFAKARKLKSKGIKVLSLFFIDRVANYRNYDNPEDMRGKFAVWFEEAFNQIQALPVNKDVIPYDIKQVHNGYFSSDKTGKGAVKKEIWIDSKEGNTKKDDETFKLIMQEKERLLSMDEPLQFIFSHSALREGWDNPNVFQICTLNETKSEMKKRQEIGRGLRLPVNSDGVRIQDKNINILTVIANETYEDFSKALQTEIQTETSVDFSGRIKNTREKARVSLSKELTIENYPLLFDIWERIKYRTTYSVEFETKKLISKTIEELQDFNLVPKVKQPILESRTARLEFIKDKEDNVIALEGTLQDSAMTRIEAANYPIPDIYAYIQNKLNITRSTIYQILKGSNRLDELNINPQMFLDSLIAAIQRNLNALLVEGVKYKAINGSAYEMTLLNNEEVTYLSSLFPKKNNQKLFDKTIYKATPIDDTGQPTGIDDFICVNTDSDIECDFAEGCNADENVKFFFKLPKKFKIPTPIGNYNPDWAVVLEEEGKSKVYFVAETKGTRDWQALRPSEAMKIKCGEKHFELFKDKNIEYKLAITAKDLY